VITVLTKPEQTEELPAIDMSLANLEQQLDSAKMEEKKLIEKRNRLNEDFRKSREEIRSLRKERDNLNERVQNLKILRDEINSKSSVIIEELKAINQKIEELKTKTPKRRHDDLQREIDEIEWKIQTTTLDMNEEKRLVEEVKQLEKQLQTYKRIEKQKKKALELKSNLNALRTQADNFHQELSSIAQKSQETHAKMISKIGESRKAKGDADSLHLAYLQIKERTKPIIDEYKRTSEKIRQLLEKTKTEHENYQKEKGRELKERLVAEARDKLQQGKKLNWNEFQLLNEENPETEN
jgi:uncharacterized coiled-coil DUF342 family protein